MLKQNNKTGKVEEPQPRYSAPLVDAMCKEINRHRGDYATTSPDEDDNSFYSGSQVSEDNSDEASYDDGDCAPFGGCGDDDNDSFKSEVSDEIDIASVEEQTVTGAPIGIPGLCGISDWLFAADYDNQSMAPDDAKKRDTNLKRTKELQNHHGQLDICGRSPESLKLRKHSQPPHPESPDHILVKVQVSIECCFADGFLSLRPIFSLITVLFFLLTRCRHQLSQCKILLGKSPMTMIDESLVDKSWEKSAV